MNVGTKSLLFGVHQVFLHPLWVALAWWKLYGFPWDPRLWVAFVVHDWGYWGCPEMDGPKGDLHPYKGAEVMLKAFGSEWYNFCLYHSRFLAKQNGTQPSKLCMADKLAVALEPWWLYLPRALASGELKEYMRSAESDGKHGHINLRRVTPKQWYLSVQKYLRRYVAEHRDGKEDRVTQIKGGRFDSGENCVWL